MIEELIGRVFAARNIAHVHHLTTSSYSQHEALGGFYEALIEALDELAECYQGQFGEIGHVELNQPESVESVASYLREESDWIESNRDEIAGGSASIGALVDVLVSVYLRAVFKLERLR